MRRRLVGGIVLLAAVVGSASARAEIADSSAAGFRVRYTASLRATPAAAYDAIVRHVGAWWSSDHTFSGDAKNLSIVATPGGCFCERLPGGGGVRHLTVVHAAPGKRLCLIGGLGPLQQAGVAGSMTWNLTAADGGTTLEMTYAVGGYVPGGITALAPIVDSVLGEQFERARRFIETGKPE
jgi:hypothetical protein